MEKGFLYKEKKKFKKTIRMRHTHTHLFFLLQTIDGDGGKKKCFNRIESNSIQSSSFTLLLLLLLITLFV